MVLRWSSRPHRLERSTLATLPICPWPHPTLPWSACRGRALGREVGGGERSEKLLGAATWQSKGQGRAKGADPGPWGRLRAASGAKTAQGMAVTPCIDHPSTNPGLVSQAQLGPLNQMMATLAVLAGRGGGGRLLDHRIGAQSHLLQVLFDPDAPVL